MHDRTPPLADATPATPQPARAGDEGEVASLFERHLPDLEAYVRRRTDPVVSAKETVSDLVQSVCREVVEHADRFRHAEDDGFRRWLFRTAERKIIDRYRYYTAERRHSSREVPLPGDDSTDRPFSRLMITPSMDAVGREQLRQIEAAFDRLPETYRRVIAMSRMHQMSHSEIARRLGRTEGAARNLLYRGLVALSALLEEERGRP